MPVLVLLQVEERKTPDSDTYTPIANPLQHSFIPGLYPGFQDSYIPFPRTCGARFNSTGKCIILPSYKVELDQIIIFYM